MNSKALIWICMTVGTTAGAYTPLIWGGDSFSMASLALSALGGIGGIWVGFKLGHI